MNIQSSVVFVIWTIAMSTGCVVVRHANKTVCEFDSVSFDCQSTTNETVDWSVRSLEHPSLSRIHSHEGIFRGFEDRFSVTPSRDGLTYVYTLRISNVTVNDTGTYSCEEDSGTGKSAALVALHVIGVHDSAHCQRVGDPPRRVVNATDPTSSNDKCSHLVPSVIGSAILSVALTVISLCAYDIWRRKRRRESTRTVIDSNFKDPEQQTISAEGGE